MGSKNTLGYKIRGGKLHVQGSIEGEFKRYSTGLDATKKNETYIKKNHRSELLRIHAEKTAKPKVSQNLIDYAEICFNRYENDREQETTREYKGVLKRYIKPTFENYDLTDISRSDLIEWQKKLAKTKGQRGDILSAKRVNNIRSIFYTILEEAVKDEILAKNPFENIKREDESKEVDAEEDVFPFTLEEVQHILANATGWQKDFIQIAFFTGLRTGEIVGLRWDDINFFNDEIHVKRTVKAGRVKKPKTKNSVRVVDILPPVKDALLRMKKNTYLKNSYVFLNDNGDHFYDGSIVRNGVWKNTLKLCGLDYRVLYQTRHTFATMMISRGEDITWVSQTLGHSSVEITLKVYTKYIKTDKRKRATFLDSFATAEQNEQKTAQVVNVVSKTAQTTAQNNFKIEKVS